MFSKDGAVTRNTMLCIPCQFAPKKLQYMPSSRQFYLRGVVTNTQIPSHKGFYRLKSTLNYTLKSISKWETSTATSIIYGIQQLWFLSSFQSNPNLRTLQ